MFILKKGHKQGVYVPLRALFLVLRRIGKKIPALIRLLTTSPSCQVMSHFMSCIMRKPVFAYAKAKALW